MQAHGDEEGPGRCYMGVWRDRGATRGEHSLILGARMKPWDLKVPRSMGRVQSHMEVRPRVAQSCPSDGHLRVLGWCTKEGNLAES